MIEARRSGPVSLAASKAPAGPAERPAQPPVAPGDRGKRSDPTEQAADKLNIRTPAAVLVILALAIGMLLGLLVIVLGSELWGH